MKKNLGIYLNSSRYVVVSVLLSAGTALAHLPAYEGERIRNDNHFTIGGFAAPVRGECDVFAQGPTDPKAGSANKYLGEGNIPQNFFCNWTSQDDWSFKYPLDIIESSRTPSPDPQTLGLNLEEGYVPCLPQSLDPFQCKREILNPQNGTKIVLPGQCVDLGQPDDPAASAEPDGNYHCALLPGAPRPRTSSVLMSTLTGPNDVDWAVYKYDPSFGSQPIVGAPQVPACDENLESYVTFAYAGPIGMKDSRSGESLFMPISQAGSLPKEVVENLPEGYGIRVKRPGSFTPTPANRRQAYASGFAQNAWLLAPNSIKKCIDSFEECLADPDLAKHYTNNDIFFVNEDKATDLYLMWWSDAERSEQSLTDVSITTGVIDQFIIGDFMNVSVSGKFTGNGRYIHGKCSEPNVNKVDMFIETNN